MQNVFFIGALYTKMEGVPPSWFIRHHCNLWEILTKDLTDKMLVHVTCTNISLVKFMIKI